MVPIFWATCSSFATSEGIIPLFDGSCQLLCVTVLLCYGRPSTR